MAAWEFRRQQTARKAVRELERWGCGSAEGDGNEAVTKVEGSAVESPAKRKSAGEKLLIAGEWKQNEKCWIETG